MSEIKNSISVLITDLDNTLFDWFDIWYHPFSAMMENISSTSQIPLDVLLPEVRTIHQKYGTSEYSFLIDEIPSLRKLHPNESIADVYQDAINIYGTVRNQHMKLYEHVLDTFEHLRSKGTLIVAYTESKAYYTNYRMRKLQLDRVIDYLYSPADHDLPEGLTSNDIRSYPDDHYKLKLTKHRHTPHGTIKPDPSVLLDIVNEVGADVSQCIYIGDSLFKDIDMAQNAGIVDVYAEYGVAQSHEGYELLRQVSHWTDKDVQKEKQTSKKNVVPSYTCRSSIREVLDMFSFSSHA